MKNDSTAQILSKIEQDVIAEKGSNPKPLPCDRWLASSILQKSIRRNDPRTATRAAYTLWQQDRRSLWRRLHIICLEDIGVASPDAIVKTLAAFNDAPWRAKMGDLKIALYLTRLLCSSIKIRLADEMYSITDRAPEYRKLREVLAVAGNHYLADYALDQNRPLAERCLALWFLAGTRRYPSDNLPERTGSLNDASDVIHSLNVPADLTQSCIAVLNKSQWPLALCTPLLWAEIQKQSRPLLISYDKFQPSSVMDGIPLAALDGFTRTGKLCFGSLKKSVIALKPFSATQIALATFYLEGSCVDKRLTCERLDEYRQAGEVADAESVGMDAPHYLGLRDILNSHTDTLEDIRRTQLRRYLQTAQNELAFGEGV